LAKGEASAPLAPLVAPLAATKVQHETKYSIRLDFESFKIFVFPLMDSYVTLIYIIERFEPIGKRQTLKFNGKLHLVLNAYKD